MFITLLISIFTTRMICCSAARVEFCPNFDPIHDFDEDAVLGMWYIHEYIYHKENLTRTEYNPYCPIIQIRKFEDYVNGGLITRDLVSAFVAVLLNLSEVYLCV